MEPPDDLPKSPSGRVPQWVIDEREARANQASAPAPAPAPPAGPGPAAPPATPRGTAPPNIWAAPPLGRPVRRPSGSDLRALRRRWPAILLAVVVTGLVITAGLRYQPGRPSAAPSPTAVPSDRTPAAAGSAGGGTTAPSSDGTTDVIRDERGEVLVQVPPPGRGEQLRPIGRPAPLATTSQHYEFQRTQLTGGPVGWDPCREIHYVVRPDHAPPGADRVLREALAQVSRATGLVFVADGATDERPSLERDAYLPKRYPGRWAPVLVAWTTAAETPDLGSGAMALGGNVVVEADDRPTVVVSGSVLLNADVLDDAMLSSAAGRRLAHASALHALATVVGLAPVDARGELMDLAPDFEHPVYTFGPGDRAGLAELGRGPCAPRL